MELINVIVKAQLTAIGNQTPYFSITGSAYEKGFRQPTTGCVHDEIEAFYPGVYTDLIAMHLSNIDGVPMHAVENGYYFIQCVRGDKNAGQYCNYTIETIMRHLRIGREEAESLLTMKKETFVQYCEDQKPRWKKEAEAAIAKHKLEIVS